jgi:hypothetical protein
MTTIDTSFQIATTSQYTSLVKKEKGARFKLIKINVQKFISLHIIIYLIINMISKQLRKTRNKEQAEDGKCVSHNFNFTRPEYKTEICN